MSSASNIYVMCGGFSDVNGEYTPTIDLPGNPPVNGVESGWERTRTDDGTNANPSGYVITYNSYQNKFLLYLAETKYKTYIYTNGVPTLPEIPQYNETTPATVLYSSSGVQSSGTLINTTNWTVVAGNSVTDLPVKVYSLGTPASSSIQTLSLTSISNNTINGNYTYNSNSNRYVRPMVYGDTVSYAIVSIQQNGNWHWNIISISGTTETVLYNSYFLSDFEIPLTSTLYKFSLLDLDSSDSDISIVPSPGPLCNVNESPPLMKILMKTVQVVVIANSTLNPQVNGTYYLANPGNGFNSFFSTDGGNSYPRILYDSEYQEEYPYVIHVAPASAIYYGIDNNSARWPEVSDIDNATWYNDADGNPANINVSLSTANRAHVYKTGNTVYGRI